MLKHPVEQSLFKSDVAAEFFALDPLVTQNLISLRQELPVQAGILQEIGPIRGRVGSSHYWIINPTFDRSQS